MLRDVTALQHGVGRFSMNNWSIKSKLLATVSLLIVVILIVMTVLAMRSLDQTSSRTTEVTRALMTEQVRQRVTDSGEAAGQQVRRLIDQGFVVPLTLARQLAATAQGSGTEPLSRAAVRGLVENALQANPGLSALYAQFEANGYDGQDANHVGDTSHSTPMGTLEVYWLREDGQLLQQPVEDADEKHNADLTENGLREAEWYLCSRDRKAPCLLEPYLYETSPGTHELMTTLAAPVLVDGQFRGLVGADINLPVIQRQIEALAASLYEGQAEVTLLTDGGRIVASSRYRELLGKPLAEPTTVQDESATIHVEVPLPFELTGNRWGLRIDVPTAVAFRDLDALVGELKQTAASTRWSLLVVGVVSLLIALLGVVVMVNAMTRRLTQLGERMNRLAGAEGDLTQRLTGDGGRELALVAEGFNAFIHKIRDIVIDIRAEGDDLRNNARQLHDAGVETTQATSLQLAEIDQVVTAINEMAATAGEVARLATDTASDTQSANRDVRGAQSRLEAVVKVIEGLAVAMRGAGDSVSQVASRSDSIYGIVGTIRGIADQTNLLALNAAIEAARAGEQGRGFAVVADEVRSLAAKTQSSTEEIDKLIAALREDVDEAVGQVQRIAQEALSTVTQSRDSYDLLKSVTDLIGFISERITQVATAAEEQSAVSEELNRNMVKIGEASRTLADVARRVDVLGGAVATTSDDIATRLEQFRI